MKRRSLVLILIAVFFSKFSTAQILCIYCYDQNDTISAGINNLLLNGGFENNNCAPQNWFSSSYCPNSSYYNCDIVNWTCTGGGYQTYADVVDLAWGMVVEGTNSVYLGNHYCNACPGGGWDTSCISSMACGSTGVPANYPVNQDSGYGGSVGISLSQTVGGLVPGNIYVLEFWAGGEMGHPLPGLFALDVGFGDTLLREKMTQPPTDIGTRFIVEFLATSSSHTIKFTNWGHICAGCTELVLDDARLYTQAELSAAVPHCTVGMSNYAGSPLILNVYPNPVNNKLNVESNSNEPLEIVLYDFTSRKILRENFTNNTTLNTEQLSKGIYFYEIRSIDENKKRIIKTGKVIKQ